MRAIRIEQPAPDRDHLALEVKDVPRPVPGAGQCLVEVHGSGVNPSDAKGVLGQMHKCVWPRTPGRDYAGVVVAGPKRHIGREVWGSGGDLGMGVDGAHGEFILLGSDTINDKPGNVSMLEAAAVGVPFCTAYIGLVENARIEPEDWVAVYGANGSVGKAVIQMALAMKGRVIAIVRGANDDLDAYKDRIAIIPAGEDLAGRVREATGGGGVDIAFNTVGGPYFDDALLALGHKGRLIIINAIEPREIKLDLFDFYRRQLRLIGMASMSHDAVTLGVVLAKLAPMFEQGTLKPFPILIDHIFTLENAAAAYRLVIEGKTRNRVVIDPRA